MKTLFQSRFCPLCGQIHTEKNLCRACQKLLPLTGNICQICGIPLIDTSITFCGQCLNKSHPYQSIISCFWYQEPLQTLIHEYKFREKLFLRPTLGQLMLEKIQSHYSKKSENHYPECLIPVPIHKKRLKERGYHQVYELTKILSKHLSIPIDLKACRRHRHSLPQSQLPFQLRKDNVQHVFEAKKISYKHIALIDDVVTTGATITSASHILKQKNPELLIEVWCLARTKPKNKM